MYAIAVRDGAEVVVGVGRCDRGRGVAWLKISGIGGESDAGEARAKEVVIGLSSKRARRIYLRGSLANSDLNFGYVIDLN